MQISERERETLVEWLCLGLLITLAYVAIPAWVGRVTWRLFPESMKTERWWGWYREVLALAFAAALALGACKRNGLRIGSIAQHWRKVLLVCSAPVVLTAIVYPLLPVRPFAGASIAMWLTSPWHQDLVFAGFLYGRFEKVAPSYVSDRIRIRWALLLASLFFSLYHLPGLLFLPAGYVVFQLAYTFFGMLLVGLARQWTGSIVYGALAHMAVNYIAWLTS